MLLRDIEYALRSLRRTPSFTATVVTTLACGLGVSVAIFSILNGVLLRPLPYGEPNRLAVITADHLARGERDAPFAPGDFDDIRERATLFDGVAAVETLPGVTIDREGLPPERIEFATATSNIFDVFQLPVAYGRNFTPADATPGVASTLQIGTAPDPGRSVATRAVILSYEFWRRAYGGDTAVIGKNIRVFAVTARIVGIASPRAELLLPPRMNVQRAPDVWLPAPERFKDDSRDAGQWRVIGRIKRGTTMSAARAQIEAIGTDLRYRVPVRATTRTYLRLEPMKAYLVADARPAMYALAGAACFVLLIAFANVANLLLLRAAQRERELAVRIALGASPAAIITPLVIESLLLAVASAVAGVVFAQVTITLLLQLVPWNLPRLADVSIDLTVLAFALVVTLAAAMIFALVPALSASRPKVLAILQSSGRQAGLSLPTRFRDIVVVAEVGLSFVLLIGCGLMIRTYLAVARIDLGFEPNGLVTFVVGDLGARSLAEAVGFPRQLHDRLAAIPGVASVTASLTLPLSGQQPEILWGPEAAVGDPTRIRQARSDVVWPGYFAAMKTRLIAGREFNDADVSPDARVVVLDELAAKAVFGNEPAVGKTVVALWRTDAKTPFTVVGVVAHQRHTTVAGEERESVYLPYAGLTNLNRWIVRTTGDPAKLAPAIRAAVASGNWRTTGPAVDDVHPMTDLVRRATAAPRFALAILLVFAVMAGLLTAIGLYGVLSTLVRQRTVEIAIRMALGAPEQSIFALVIGHGLKLGAVGLLIGGALALTATRVMLSLLVGVRPTDPLTFSVATIGFLAIVATACWLPARRAAALDPAVALRNE